MRQPHVEHFGFDDGADIHAMLLRNRGIACAPEIGVRVLHDAAIAVVATQRVAAGGDEIDDAIELHAREISVGRGAGDLFVQFIRIERLTAGAAHDVLSEAIEAADANGLAVKRALLNRFLCGAAFQHFEAIAGSE